MGMINGHAKQAHPIKKAPTPPAAATSLAVRSWESLGRVEPAALTSSAIRIAWGSIAFGAGLLIVGMANTGGWYGNWLAINTSANATINMAATATRKDLRGIKDMAVTP